MLAGVSLDEPSKATIIRSYPLTHPLRFSLSFSLALPFTPPTKQYYFLQTVSLALLPSTSSFDVILSPLQICLASPVAHTRNPSFILTNSSCSDAYGGQPVHILLRANSPCASLNLVFGMNVCFILSPPAVLFVFKHMYGNVWGSELGLCADVVHTASLYSSP